MEKYAILTDSTCDLVPAQAREHDIIILPMGFTVGDRHYLHYPDERELSIREFYALLRTGIVPGTSAVSPGDWQEAVEREFAAGRDALIITFSSALSCAWQNAVIAAENLTAKFPSRRVKVIDSLCASLGQGMFVLMAAELRARGVAFEEAVTQLEINKMHVCHWFTVADLGHLRRGGRISRTTAVVGTALGIKPILHVDNEGRLVGVDKSRGRHRAVMELLHRMEKTAIEPARQTIYISHADCREDADTLADEIKKRFGVEEIVINFVGPIAGGHAGPATLALFFLGKER